MPHKGMFLTARQLLAQGRVSAYKTIFTVVIGIQKLYAAATCRFILSFCHVRSTAGLKRPVASGYRNEGAAEKQRRGARHGTQGDEMLMIRDRGCQVPVPVQSCPSVPFSTKAKDVQCSGGRLSHVSLSHMPRGVNRQGR